MNFLVSPSSPVSHLRPSGLPQAAESRSTDDGAAAAIENMSQREAVEQIALRMLPFPVQGLGWVTGEELLGDLVDGISDWGDELAELTQFQVALRAMDNLDPGARRVRSVIDTAITRLRDEGRTFMTNTERAEFLRDCRHAADQGDVVLDSIVWASGRASIAWSF